MDGRCKNILLGANLVFISFQYIRIILINSALHPSAAKSINLSSALNLPPGGWQIN